MENVQESEMKLEENIVITDAVPISSWRPPADYVPEQVVPEQVVPEQVVPEPVRRPIPAPSTVGGEVYGLPEGWIVEERPRTNPKYHGKYDKIFYAPERKIHFRSRKQALSYQREVDAKRNGDQQQPQPGPENDNEQAAGEKEEKQTEVALEDPKGDLSNEPSPKRSKTDGAEFDSTKPPEKVTSTLTDAGNNVELTSTLTDAGNNVELTSTLTNAGNNVELTSTLTDTGDNMETDP